MSGEEIRDKRTQGQTPAEYNDNLAFNLRSGAVVERNRRRAARFALFGAAFGAVAKSLAVILVTGALMFGQGLSDFAFWLGLIVGGIGYLIGRRKWAFGGWAGYCPVCDSPIFVHGERTASGIGADCPTCRTRVVLKNGKFTAFH